MYVTFLTLKSKEAAEVTVAPLWPHGWKNVFSAFWGLSEEQRSGAEPRKAKPTLCKEPARAGGQAIWGCTPPACQGQQIFGQMPKAMLFFFFTSKTVCQF